jgi:predicted NAD/FAD-dependent oxidoreductase
MGNVQHYVIIGNGMAGNAAAAELRESTTRSSASPCGARAW